MFDLGWSEMAVIMLVALVVIGPKDLPRLARSVGQWVAKGRAMARDFQRSLEEMAREAELDDVKREIEKVGRTNISKTIEKTIDPTGALGKAFDPNSSGKSGAKAAGSIQGANGAAAKPAIAEPAVAAEPTVAAEPAVATAPATPKAVSKPKAAAKPRASGTAKAAAKPKTAAKSMAASTAKTAAKAGTTARPKTSEPKTSRTASKPASPEPAEAEPAAEPR